jgi:flagellar biosynthesis/type III secretory pathway chaperone
MLEQSVSLINLREENLCKDSFVSLIDILRKESAVYQELKNTIIYEQQILKKPVLDELNHNNAVKENIVLKARMLEEARTSLLKKIARSLDINTKGIKLSQLAGYAGVDQRRELEELKEDLAMVAREINLINEANKNLLDTSLMCVQSSLDFIVSAMSQGSVYVESGQIKTMQNNGKFLRTEG